MRSFAASAGRRAVIGLIAVILGAAVWVAAEQPASAHGACRYGGERVSGITASAWVRCATAQRVAAAYDRAVLVGGSFPSGRVRAAGYTCATTPLGGPEEETFTVRCARRGGVVHFGWGV